MTIGNGMTRRGLGGVLGSALLASGAISPAADLAQSQARTGPDEPTLHARDFGIVGDQRQDETAKVQAFLDHCAAVGVRIAHFGLMRIRISGPLVSRSVGIVFDTNGYGFDDPGFHVTGNGYTALTILGTVADFCAMVCGHGDVEINKAGKVMRDDRPAVNGIQFGQPGNKTPFLLSFVRYARAFRLGGFGIRHVSCWDCSFVAESIEECGNAGEYAFQVLSSAENNTSECIWHRLQVEQSVLAAMYIEPYTLSCVFEKIHSERTRASPSMSTWILGGNCEFGSVRLHCDQGSGATALFRSSQGQCRNLRGEAVAVLIDATGGSFQLHGPQVTALAPSPGQNGKIQVIGGSVRELTVGANWLLIGCEVRELRVGFMPPGASATAVACDINALSPAPRETTGAVVFQACVVRSAALSRGADRIKRIALLAETSLSPAGNMLNLREQSLLIDASSAVRGAVQLNASTLQLDGRIEGDLIAGEAAQVIAGHGGIVTGQVQNWRGPVSQGAEGAVAEGTYCKNLRPGATAAERSGGIVLGWVFAKGTWIGMRAG